MRILALFLAAWVLLAGSLLDFTCHEAPSCPAAFEYSLSLIVQVGLNPFFSGATPWHQGPSSLLERPPQLS